MFFSVSFCYLTCSASTSNVAKLEEMERLLREAQAEKRSLLEHKVIRRESDDSFTFTGVLQQYCITIVGLKIQETC